MPLGLTHRNKKNVCKKKKLNLPTNCNIRLSECIQSKYKSIIDLWNNWNLTAFPQPFVFLNIANCNLWIHYPAHFQNTHIYVNQIRFIQLENDLSSSLPRYKLLLICFPLSFLRAYSYLRFGRRTVHSVQIICEQHTRALYLLEHWRALFPVIFMSWSVAGADFTSKQVDFLNILFTFSVICSV